MHFIYRYPFLIALLLRFSLGFPSSGDKNEPSERFEGLHIGEINIYIHCYFNKDDPICKDERNDVPETEEGEASNSSGNDKTDSDESYEEELDVDGGGVSSSSTNDDLDNNEDYEEAPDDVNINDKLPSLTSIKSSVNELFGSYEPAADSNKFEDMENYSEYWPSRIRARDELCVMCLAIMTNQEILESEHAMNKVRTNRGSNWKMLRAIVEKLGTTKVQLGLEWSEPIPIQNGLEVCSIITQREIHDRALTRRDRIQYESVSVETKYEFYNRFIGNMEDDPRFLDCEATDKDDIARMSMILRGWLLSIHSNNV